MSIYSICHLNKNYIISTEGIKTNELKVLHDISLEIKEGEMLGIIGKSGCGKTTEYSCAMKSHFRKFGNQMSGSGNHLCNYASLLA